MLAYYFELHRVCHLDEGRIGLLKVPRFALLIDSIDQHLKNEVQLAGLRAM